LVNKPPLVLGLIIAEFENLLIFGDDPEESFARLQPLLLYAGYLMLFVLPKERFRPLGIGMA
jgi:hypothetical protein